MDTFTPIRIRATSSWYCRNQRIRWTPSEAQSKHDRRDALGAPGVTPLAKIEVEAQREAHVSPSNIDVKLALIDFGMTARLSTTLKEHVIRLLLDLADNRGDDAAETMIEIGDELPGFERDKYVREIASLMARGSNRSVGEMDSGKAAIRVDQHFIPAWASVCPAELTMLAKTLFNLDTVTRAIDATFSPVPTIREFATRLAASRAKEMLNPRRLHQLASQSNDLLMALPHRLDLISARIASNEFETKIAVPQMASMIEALQKVANRIFSGLVLAGIAGRERHDPCRTTGRWASADFCSPARSDSGWCCRFYGRIACRGDKLFGELAQLGTNRRDAARRTWHSEAAACRAHVPPSSAS